MSNKAFAITVTAMLIFTHLTAYAVLAQEEEFRYESGDFRNPFIPLVTPEGRLVQLERKVETAKGDIGLEGIIYDPYGVSYAIVNGLVVKIGDYVGDSQVLKIKKNAIFFIKDGQITEFELKKEGKGEEEK